MAFLDYLRDAVVAKLDGLDDEQAQQPGVPSGTSLLGLVKHLTMVEAAWFTFGFAGSDDTVPEGRLQPHDRIESIVEDYRAACAASNDVIASCPDLDQSCARNVTAPQPMSLRWVLVHMIEETARHAGHADILRERIDGAVGR